MLFIANGSICQCSSVHMTLALSLLSLSFSLSLSSLQKITHPQTSTYPSGPKATRSCTKNSSAHNMHTLFLSTRTFDGTLFLSSDHYWFWHLHFYKITAFFSAGVYSSDGFRDSGDIPLWKIVNLWCNHFQIVLLIWNVIETVILQSP